MDETGTYSSDIVWPEFHSASTPFDIRLSILQVVISCRREKSRDLIDKWIQDRGGPSFHTKNVIDARCLHGNHQRQQFVCHMPISSHSFVCPVSRIQVSE